MIPQKIISLLETVLKLSQDDKVKWSYDDENDIVSPFFKNIKLNIFSGFNSDREEHFYRVDVTDSQHRSASYVAYESDYGHEIAKKVFDEGTASAMEIDLDNL